MSDRETAEFDRQRHVTYFKRCLQIMPAPYISTDTNRLTLAFFALSALDLLNALEEAIDDHQRRDYIDWIYSLQVLPSSEEVDAGESSGAYRYCGFRGAPALGNPFSAETAGHESIDECDRANIAMTYTALCTLLILGDDLSRINQKAVIAALKFLQQEDGSFSPIYDGHENDMRFLYCACVISHILNDWSAVNRSRAMQYVCNCLTFDFGISQAPDQESHGGSTFCGVATLALIDQTHSALPMDKVVLWMLRRQGFGFSGRLNKMEDTCYSFWIGGALAILSAHQFINKDLNIQFLLATQTKHGGFGKLPGDPPDVLHSYMGVAAFALFGQSGLREHDPILNVPKRVSSSFKNNNWWWQARTC